MKCPNCNNKIEDNYFECEHRCSYEEIWWCSNCGAICVSWDGKITENWDLPNNSN